MEKHAKKRAPGRAERAAITAADRVVSALRIALGAFLFVPLLALPVYVNYYVDCQGYFLGDSELRTIATALFEGHAVVGYDQMNGRDREVLDVIVANMDESTTPETIALGSSRVMQLTKDIVGTSFYNSATTGGDFYDMLTSFYVYDKRGKLPKNVIVEVDPWLFNIDPDAQDKRSNKTLYTEFLAEKLGIPGVYEKEDPAKTWQFLFDLSYFQGNLEFLAEGTPAKSALEIVDGAALYTQSGEVKCADGSLIYTPDFRSRTQEEIDTDALIQTGAMFRVEGYDAPDAERVAVFETWIRYMQNEGLNVFFLLTPYPPIVYDHAVANAGRYGGFFGAEETVRVLGKKYGVPVYGSYNPHAIPAVAADFYDGLHPRGECLARFFPGIPQALSDRDAGIDVSLDPSTPAPAPAEN